MARRLSGSSISVDEKPWDNPVAYRTHKDAPGTKKPERDSAGYRWICADHGEPGDEWEPVALYAQTHNLKHPRCEMCGMKIGA
jgi:hypothetical protein